MKRNIYHPAIGCSCGLHTWPTLLQSVCNYSLWAVGIELQNKIFVFDAVYRRAMIERD